MKKSILLLLFLMLVGGLSMGQNTDEKIKFVHAEELRKSYRFSDAIVLYKEIISETADTNFQKTIIAQIARSENGMKMLEYGISPGVYGSIDVPIKDFYLNYPDIPDSTWILVPRFLNRNSRDYPINNIMVHKPGEKTMYFSGQGKDGSWDIFSTQQLEGNKWSTPIPLSSTVNSPGDELFPIISADGKQLYFSSTGHSGMGGFDLYVSYWDDKTNGWGVPQNLGFPYSSPADDYLFVNTASGNYSVFASNRDVTSGDSIRIYQLDFENTPVKRAVGTTEEALDIASLKFKGKTVQTVREEPNEYAKMFQEVRRIKVDIGKITKDLNANRDLYNKLDNPEEKAILGKKITESEMLLLEQQTKLTVANKLVQEREMDFLNKGIIIPREDFFKDSTSVSDSSSAKHKMVPKLTLYGSLPSMEILDPVVPIDYTFKILDEAVIMADNTIPGGLVYSIQLFLLSGKATIESLKGLSPVFETLTPTGKNLYTVGHFNTYEELTAALTLVKSLKMTNIIGIAYLNGKNISLKEARLMEGKAIDENTYQVQLAQFPDGIPQPILDLIRKTTDKDIALKVINEKNIYLVGPFNNKQDADLLATALREVAEGISVETLTPEKK